MKLKKGILFFSLATLLFLFLKESGFYSNLLPNFTSVCLGSFLLPEDQRETVSRMVEEIHRRPKYNWFAREINNKIYCFTAADVYERRKSLTFTHSGTITYGLAPPIYSIYPLKVMRNLKELNLPLATDDIRPLEYLTQVDRLTITFYKGFDISPTDTHLPFKDLNLPINGFTKLEPIKKLKKLYRLTLRKSANGYPFDLNSLLSELPNLKDLVIFDPDFVDVESISNFQNLESISFYISPKARFSSLQNLKQLKYIYIYETQGAECPKILKGICSVTPYINKK
jgi:hypothetical protein